MSTDARCAALALRVHLGRRLEVGEGGVRCGSCAALLAAGDKWCGLFG
jgi:hypothetical protein